MHIATKSFATTRSWQFIGCKHHYFRLTSYFKFWSGNELFTHTWLGTPRCVIDRTLRTLHPWNILHVADMYVADLHSISISPLPVLSIESTASGMRVQQVTWMIYQLTDCILIQNNYITSVMNFRFFLMMHFYHVFNIMSLLKKKKKRKKKQWIHIDIKVYSQEWHKPTLLTWKTF